MKNGDKPANPIVNSEGFCTELNNISVKKDATGMSKREMFAMAAMQGLLPIIHRYNPSDAMELLCADAVEMADALLAELENTEVTK